MGASFLGTTSGGVPIFNRILIDHFLKHIFFGGGLVGGKKVIMKIHEDSYTV